MNAASLRGWTPVRVGVHQPSVQWAMVDGDFSEPFFEHTADRAVRQPFNAAFARFTPLGALDALGTEAGAEPAGVIFHMSRCGSTLITQMLARARAVAALSEPQPVDGIVRLRGVLPGGDGTIVRCLRGLVAAFSAAMPGRRVVVKLHAWHVLALPLLREAWPNAPWAFAFREPRAVLRSQARSTGAELVPGTIDPRYLDLAGASAPTGDEYGARVLAAFCDAALRAHAGDRALLIDYDALPGAVLDAIVPRFGLTVDETEMPAVRDAATIDAKAGRGAFRPAEDAPDKHIDALAARLLDERYDALRRAAAAR